jgi:hypothetical protein
MLAELLAERSQLAAIMLKKIVLKAMAWAAGGGSIQGLPLMVFQAKHLFTDQ